MYVSTVYGWCCRVTGSYGVAPTGNYALNTDHHNTLPADDTEQIGSSLHNWCLAFLAFACFITTATVTFDMQRKRKRLLGN